MQQLLLKNASEDNTVKPHSSDAAASSSYLQAFLELIDFGPLILRILLDPVGSLYANVPHVLPTRFRRGNRFPPKDGSLDLSGKVILVTGGKWEPHINAFPG